MRYYHQKGQQWVHEEGLQKSLNLRVLLLIRFAKGSRQFGLVGAQSWIGQLCPIL